MKDLAGIKYEYLNMIEKNFPHADRDTSYPYQILSDIWTFIEDNISCEEVLDALFANDDGCSFEDILMSIEWGDSIHGNGSGSYFFSIHESQQMVIANWDMTIDNVTEFYPENTPITVFREWETLDVLNRLALLPNLAQMVWRFWQTMIHGI